MAASPPELLGKNGYMLCRNGALSRLSHLGNILASVVELSVTRYVAFPLWCKTQGLPAPVAEHRFHPERKWRFDFAFVEYRVAVEIHGSVYRQGRHTRGTGFLDDREKMVEAQLLGWRVLEVAPSGRHPATLYSPDFLRWLRAALEA